ncbi:MAG: hypothetical protein AAGG48_26985 [Planctomycetota bacterium]
MTFLLFEDDQSAGKKLKQLIELEFGEDTCLWAKSPEEADEIHQENTERVLVLIADVMKDGKPVGLELVEEHSGFIPTIVISGHKEEEFAEYRDRFGPIVYLEKGPDLPKQLLPELHVALASAETERQAALAGTDRRNVCLSREPGVILQVNLHLSLLSPKIAVQPRCLFWDFSSLQVLVRELQTHVQKWRGQVCTLNHQSITAVFPGELDEDPSPFSRAIASVRETKRALGEVERTVLRRYPFSAAIVEGVIVSGMFGNRTPGLPAVVGRLGDMADQVAGTALAGEVGVIDEFLSTDSLELFKKCKGEQRPGLVSIRKLTEDVACTFINVS